MKLKCKDRKVTVDMKRHIKNMINDFDEDIARDESSPVKANLDNIIESKMRLTNNMINY